MKKRNNYDIYGDTIKPTYDNGNSFVTSDTPMNTLSPNNNSVSGTNKGSIYEQLVNIANGNYDTSNGASSLYNESKGAEQKYNNLYDFYTKNVGDMSQGEIGVANTYLQNAALDKRNANSAYNQYLASVGQAQDAKALQSAAQQNAMKYTGQALAAQGLGTQGIAESTRAGILNSYANNVASIDKNLMNNSTNLYDAYMQGVNDRALQNAQALGQAQQYDIEKAEQDKIKQEQENALKQGEDKSIYDEKIKNVTSLEDYKKITDEYLNSDIPEQMKQEVLGNYKMAVLGNLGIENINDLSKVDMETLKAIKDNYSVAFTESELSLIDNEINNKIVKTFSKELSDNDLSNIKSYIDKGSIIDGDIIEIKTNKRTEPSKYGKDKTGKQLNYYYQYKGGKFVKINSNDFAPKDYSEKAKYTFNAK